MPKNTNILLIRHAEKPDSGHGLAVAGQERAQAYVVYFQNYSLKSQMLKLNYQPVAGEPQVLKLNYLFAAADSSESQRPRLTITPLASALGLDIDDKHKDKDYSKVADDILQHSKYDRSNILICWHHGEILLLAEALGVEPAKLPPQANWPSTWPDQVFGWVLQLSYESSGSLSSSQTLCINQQLMYDDHGQDPPLS